MFVPIEFYFESGVLALDFISTRSGTNTAVVDRIGTPRDLVDWLNAAEITSERSIEGLRSSPPAARMLLRDALWLRDAISTLVSARSIDAAPPPITIDTLNRVLRASRRSTALTEVPAGDEPARGLPQYAISEEEHGPVELAPLYPIALSAAKLAIDADPKRLRRCFAETCGRWFLDTSKGGRRRWCSMTTCGNRAKAVKYYRKHTLPE